LQRALQLRSESYSGADVTEGATVLAAGVWVEGPAKAHALDRVQRGLALHLDVLHVGEPGLGRLHPPMVEQMFALDKLGCGGEFRLLC